MSWSDSGSPTAARMLISVQRFEGAGRGAAAAEASRCTGGGDGTGTGTAGCGRAFATGFGFDGPSSAFGGLSAFAAAADSLGSRGTLAERQGVRQGLGASAAVSAACAGRPCSAITVATTAIARRGEERTG